MSDTYEVLPAHPPYDSATAALLECIQQLGVFRTMTVRNIPSRRVPADEVRAGVLVSHPDIDLEDVEVFRDQDVAFAIRVRRDGGDAGLHVYPGGTHVRP